MMMTLPESPSGWHDTTTTSRQPLLTLAVKSGWESMLKILLKNTLEEQAVITNL